MDEKQRDTKYDFSSCGQRILPVMIWITGVKRVKDAQTLNEIMRLQVPLREVK